MIHLIEADNRIIKLINDAIFKITGYGNTIIAGLNDIIEVVNTKNSSKHPEYVNLASNNTLTVSGNYFSVKASATGDNTIKKFNQTDTLDLSNTDIYNSTIFKRNRSFDLETGDVTINHNNDSGHIYLEALGATPRKVTYAHAILSDNQSYIFSAGGGYNVDAAKNNIIKIGRNGYNGELDQVKGMFGGRVEILRNSSVSVAGQDYTLNSAFSSSFVATGSNFTVNLANKPVTARVGGTGTVNFTAPAASGSTINVDASAHVTFKSTLGIPETLNLGGQDIASLQGNNFTVVASGLDTVNNFNTTDSVDVSRLGIKDFEMLSARWEIGLSGSEYFTSIFGPDGRLGIALSGVNLSTQSVHIIYAQA